MDAIKCTTQNDPQVVIMTHNELNVELISTRDSMHHSYVMLARTDKQLIVTHRLSHYQAPIGVLSVAWQQKLFAFTGDMIGNQMPQTIQWSAHLLEVLPRAVCVSKLNAQVGALMNNGLDRLPPVAAGADMALYNEIRM